MPSLLGNYRSKDTHVRKFHPDLHNNRIHRLNLAGPQFALAPDPWHAIRCKENDRFSDGQCDDLTGSGLHLFCRAGSVLIASETAFPIIKLAGAAYLIYMGVGILFSSKMSVVSENNSQPQNEVSLRKIYLQAAIVTAGNPKAILFFHGDLPEIYQFRSGQGTATLNATEHRSSRCVFLLYDLRNRWAENRCSACQYKGW